MTNVVTMILLLLFFLFILGVRTTHRPGGPTSEEIQNFLDRVQYYLGDFM